MPESTDSAPSENQAPFQTCSICAEIPSYARAFQKGGQEQDDTYLPAQSAQLEFIEEIKSSVYLRQCPECKTLYLYKTYYDFLVSGSEDEQILIRLAHRDDANKHLDYWDR